MQFNEIKISSFWIGRIIIAIIFLTLLFVFVNDKNEELSDITNAQLSSSEYWQKQIRTHGAKETYKNFVFTNKAARLTSNREHENAHIFSSALYEMEGKIGLPVCGDDFKFACFHELLGQIISDLGLGVVIELNQECIGKPGSDAGFCQHGLGHGIQAHFGYIGEDLLRALTVCEKLDGNDPIGGCVGGIYMEYNFQTMLGDDANVRDTEDLFSPCNMFSGERQRACMFWQPQWWLNGESASEESVVHVGRLCVEANEDKLLQMICFNGIGNTIAAKEDYDPNIVRVLCNTSSSNNSHQLFCKSQAATNIFSWRDMEQAVLVCSGLMNEELKYCMAYAKNNFEQIPSYTLFLK